MFEIYLYENFVIFLWNCEEKVIWNWFTYPTLLLFLWHTYVTVLFLSSVEFSNFQLIFVIIFTRKVSTWCLIATFTYLSEKLFVDPNVCFIKRLFLFSRNLFCTWRKWIKFQVHRSTMNQKTIKLKILTVYLLWLFDVLQHHVFQISFLNLFRFKHMKSFVVFWNQTSHETFKA